MAEHLEPGDEQHNDTPHDFLDECLRYASEDIRGSKQRFQREKARHRENVRTAIRTRLLVREVERSYKVIEQLEEQLEDARSKVFDLQPFLKDLTPQEAGHDFDKLAANIESWVEKIIRPWMEKSEGTTTFTSAGRRRKHLADFKHIIEAHIDLFKASAYPDMDQDILIALIWRFLKEEILDRKPLDHKNIVSSCIERLHKTMDGHVIQNRDPLFTQNWRAEAYNALLALPGAQQAQTERGQVLATELGQRLAIFNMSEQMGTFVQECLETCILPSIALRDKLLVSKDNFFLNLETFCESGYLDRVEAGQDFYDHLESMVYEDLLFDRKSQLFNAGN